MALEYSRATLKVCVGQICDSLGWHAIQSTPLEMTVDILERYIEELGKNTQRYCEQFGRTEVNLDDLSMTFSDMGITLSELEDYHTHIDPIPFPRDTVEFPVARETNLLFPNPRSREIVEERYDHVPDYLPYMYPGMEEELDAEGKPVEEDGLDSPISEVLLSPLAGREKQNGLAEIPVTPTLDGLAHKRARILNNSSLPEEAGPSLHHSTVFLDASGNPVCRQGSGRLPMSCATPLALKQTLNTPSEQRDKKREKTDEGDSSMNELHIDDDVPEKDDPLKTKKLPKDTAKFGKKLTSQKIKMAKLLAKAGGKFAKGKVASKGSWLKDMMTRYSKGKGHKESGIGNADRGHERSSEGTQIDLSDGEEGVRAAIEKESRLARIDESIDAVLKSADSEISGKAELSKVEKLKTKKMSKQKKNQKRRQKHLSVKTPVDVKPERTTPVELRVFDFPADSPEEPESKPMKPLRAQTTPEGKTTAPSDVVLEKKISVPEPALFEADIPTYTASMSASMRAAKLSEKFKGAPREKKEGAAVSNRAVSPKLKFVKEEQKVDVAKEMKQIGDIVKSWAKTDVPKEVKTTEKSRDLTEKYRDSTEKYRDLTEKYRDLTEKSHDSMEKSRDSTEQIRDLTEKSRDSTSILSKSDTTREWKASEKSLEKYSEKSSEKSSEASSNVETLKVKISESLESSRHASEDKPREYKEKSKKDRQKDRSRRHEKKDRHRDKERKKNREKEHRREHHSPSHKPTVPKLKLFFSGRELAVESPANSPARNLKHDHPRIVIKPIKPLEEVQSKPPQTSASSSSSKSTLLLKDFKAGSPSPPPPKKHKADDLKHSPVYTKKVSESEKKSVDSKTKMTRDRERSLSPRPARSPSRSPSPPSLIRHRSPSPPHLIKQTTGNHKLKQREGLTVEDLLTNDKVVVKVEATAPTKSEKSRVAESGATTDEKSTPSPLKRKPGRPPKKRPSFGQNVSLNLEMSAKSVTVKEEINMSPVTVDIPRLSPRRIVKQELPPLPPPSMPQPVQRAVFAETVDTYVEETDETGEKVWICPACKAADDGSPMIGCDICDDWYHWLCVRITEEPTDDQWYCPRCMDRAIPAPLAAGKPGRGRGRGRGRGKKKKKI